MILAHVSDGLGNQLFQYAAARRLAHVHQTNLKLNLTSFSESKFRRFGLHYFNIQAETASRLDQARICPREELKRALLSPLPGPLYWRALRTLNRLHILAPYFHRVVNYAAERPLPKLRAGGLVSERFYHFDPEVLSCPDNVCLCGYWQSEKYFRDISEVIRRELTVKAPLQGENAAAARRIQETESVSLHVRRGDKATQAQHCTTTAEFCARAMAFFRARVSRPTFFVFTDDWDWVRHHLPPGDDVVLVDHNNDETNYEDLRLMSLCKNNVVAPSSFSWWAAWLNGHPQKIVVRPPVWINLGNFDTRDVFPPDWISLDQNGQP